MQEPTPTLIKDLGAIAGLYGTVFWMIGRRLQHGRGWEEKLAEEALRTYSRNDPYRSPTAAGRHN
ncbi:MAG: hypothetical protein WD904_08740 [Dehalococcoidia bacterium]